MSTPLIGIPANIRKSEPFYYHGVGQQFLEPLTNLLGFQPVIIPALQTPPAQNKLIQALDGILLTGGASNIHPSLYDAPVEGEQGFDPLRDATSLPLIRHAAAHNIPTLGICRGAQEINVAFGGTLIQALHQKKGYDEHRGWVKFSTADERRAHQAHGVSVTQGGLLHTLTGQTFFNVNSLHEQGLGKIGADLVVEAVADDGTVEAVRHNGTAFMLGVLWHPEWYYAENPISQAIFKAFGAAVHTHHAAR